MNLQPSEDNNYFYHINFKRPYNSYPAMEKDQNLSIGESNNPFYQYFFNDRLQVSITYKPNINKNIPHYVYFQNIANGNLKADSNIVGNIALENDDFYFKFTRELFLENIRLSYFPEKPSRLKCIWLGKDQKLIEKWVNEFEGNINVRVRVVLLEINGNTATLDSQLLPKQSDPHADWHEKSMKYWAGEQTESPILETLFIGNCVVREVWEMEQQVIVQ